MNLARVVGRLIATHKDDGLVGRKLLLLRPLDSRMRPAGSVIVAVDSIGAGAAELVIYVQGREASYAFLPDEVPADAGIVGIVDTVTKER